MAVTGTSTIQPSLAREAIPAGLIAGFAKLLIDTTVAPLVLADPWGVLRRTAALVLGPRVVPTTSHFGLVELVVALAIHFALSVVWGFVVVGLVRHAPRGVSILVGALVGVGIYILTYYGVIDVFPWFRDMRGPLQLLSHAAFGAVISLYLLARHPKPRLEELEPMPPRSGRFIV